MDVLYWIGRIIFGLYWLMNAFNHFTMTEQMAEYAKSKGVPAPKAAVLLSGVLLLIGGIAILFGVWVQIGLWALIVFLVGVTPVMHNFWAVQDPMARMAEMVNFTKNAALLGALLMLLTLWR
ncbi:DoxX family protein [Thermus thermophilus]|uniref:DoxX family protein n=1 Tax=Thermus thermophilus TaxID=274 RepID=A0AAD1NY39_THETH|nr:DoxX family membrane protein [Thermus thermophilus]BCZ87953.1 hypothetical protein TthAA11_21350 [Thermus thermophilus]